MEQQAWTAKAWPVRSSWLTKITVGSQPPTLHPEIAIALQGINAEAAVESLEEQITAVGIPVSLAKAAVAASVSVRVLCLALGREPTLLADVNTVWEPGWHSGDPVLSAWVRSRAYGDVERMLQTTLSKMPSHLADVDWQMSEALVVCGGAGVGKSYARHMIGGHEIDTHRGLVENAAMRVVCSRDHSQGTLLGVVIQCIKKSRWPLLWCNVSPQVVRLHMHRCYCSRPQRVVPSGGFVVQQTGVHHFFVTLCFRNLKKQNPSFSVA